MITFRHIDKTYEDTNTEVLKDFNLSIEDGEFVALTGRSGSGKSTIIKMILKEIDSDSGDIQVGEKNLSRIKHSEIPYYRRKIGVIFQDFRLISDLTAYQNVVMARQIVGETEKESRGVVTSLFKLLGITELYNRYPKEMSGGQLQKVCLARALANYPKILLADEPTGNLDPEASGEIFELLKLINTQGVTVVLATHDLQRVQDMGLRRVDL